MSSIRTLASTLGLLVAISGVALSQSQSPFTLVLSQDQQTSTIADGASVVLAAGAVGQVASATLAVTYRGSGQAGIPRFELTGPSDFSVATPPAPVVVRPGESVSIVVRYRPTSGVRASGRLVIPFDDGGKTGTISLALGGTAPDLVFSYVQLPAGNSVLIAPGDVLSFPDTAARSASTLAVTISNRGSGSGVLNAATAQGGAFQLSGLPLLPAVLEAGRDFRVNVVFSPASLGAAAGGLSFDLGGRTVTFALAGKATGPDYTYEVLQAEGVRTVAPDGEMALPDTPAGQHAKLSIRVRNRGNAEGKVSVVAAAGAGFSVTDLPFLPVSLAPGAAFVFTVDFDAAQPGRYSGRLRIGDDSFTLSALVLGGALQISYLNGSTEVKIPNNGSILFPPVAVGSSTTVRVFIRNTGTTATQISLIVIAGAGFSPSEMPDLPLALDPDQSVAFGVTASPSAAALVTGSLRIDQMTFTLSLSGQPPPALPAYRITTDAGSAGPMEQVAAGLSLATPYKLPLKGVLTLSFASDSFAADPAVQFASGGRTVTFEIPADTTTAVFPGNSTQIRFQTGSVAGAISLAAAFSYEGTSLPPPSASAPLVVQIPQSAPRILSAQVGSKSAGGLTLLIGGFATTRSVQQMEFEFAPLPNLALPPLRFTLNSDSVFTAWYQSSQSQQFGSLFAVTVPFTGTVSSGQGLADVLDMVRIRVSNQLGASAFYELSLR
jgi:hypothetical protein